MIGVLVAGSSLTAIHTLSADSTNRSHINDNNNNNISPARQQQPVIQNVAISPSNEGDPRRGDVGVSSEISVSGNVSTNSDIGVSGKVEEFAMQQQQQLQEQQQQANSTN